MHLSDHWDQYGPGASGVAWELGMLGLLIHVEQPDAPLPDEAEFAASDDGKALIAGSSEAWARAAIDGGAEPDAARAAARRTAAFYKGKSEEST